MSAEKGNFKARSDIIFGFIEAAVHRFGVDAKAIYKDLGIDRADNYRWIDWSGWQAIVRKINRMCGLTVYEWIDIGVDTIGKPSNPIYRLLFQSLSVNAYLRAVPVHAAAFTNHSRLTFRRTGKETAVYHIFSDPEFIAGNAGQAPFFQVGMIISFFRYRKIPAKLQMVYCQSYLMNILSDFYAGYDLSVTQRDDLILVDGEPVARRKELSGSEGAYQGSPVFVIIKDLVRDNKTLLHRGEVYDAPFSKLILTWQKEPLSALVRRKVCSLLMAVDFERTITRQIELFSEYSAELQPYTEAEESLMKEPSPAEVPPNFSELTEREEEVTLLLLKGRSRRDITKELHISMSTVKRHTESIYRKLDVHTRFELISAFSKNKEQKNIAAS